MPKEENSSSFYVIAAFVLLFFAFLIIQPNPESTGLISLNLGGEGIQSKLPVIIIGVTAILALGVAFMSYKHFKKKKQPETAKEGENKAPLPPQKQGLTDEELKELFPENHKEEVKAEEPVQPSIQPPIPQQEQKTLTNLTEIKTMINNLLKQGMTKEQIVSNLQAKGYSIQQITKATEEINLEHVKSYIQSTTQQGFTKEQITKILLENGWKQEQIQRAFQLLGI